MRVLLLLSLLVAYCAAQTGGNYFALCLANISKFALSSAVVFAMVLASVMSAKTGITWIPSTMSAKVLNFTLTRSQCVVGSIIDRYTIRDTPTVNYEDIVNGHPRHRVPVSATMVRDPAGLVTDMLFIRNRNTAATVCCFCCVFLTFSDANRWCQPLVLDGGRRLLHVHLAYHQ